MGPQKAEIIKAKLERARNKNRGSNLNKAKPKRKIVPRITHHDTIHFGSFSSLDIWYLDNDKYEVCKIWNGLKDKLNAESANRNDYISPSTNWGALKSPYHIVFFSGGFDSTSLILRHLEKGEPVMPFFINFSEEQLPICKLIIAILQKIYGKELIGDLREMFTPLYGKGTEDNGLIQQSFVAFFASKVSRDLTENASDIEVAYCMNDDAISYLSDLENLYKAGVTCTYPEREPIPFKFPQIKKAHLDNSIYVSNWMNSHVVLPVTEADGMETDRLWMKTKDSIWILMSDEKNLYKENKCCYDRPNAILMKYYTGESAIGYPPLKKKARMEVREGDYEDKEIETKPADDYMNKEIKVKVPWSDKVKGRVLSKEEFHDELDKTSDN